MTLNTDGFPSHTVAWFHIVLFDAREAAHYIFLSATTLRGF